MTALDLGTSRKDVLCAALVLLHVELEHTLLSCYLMDFFHVDGTQVLDVDWPTLHRSSSQRLFMITS